MKDVTPSLLSGYKAMRLQTITKRGNTVSPDTVRKELSFLRTVFNTAIDEWELCRENPVRKVMKSLPSERKRVRYVTPEEAEKLRFTLPGWLSPIVIVACQTGLRRGDLLHLTEGHLDFSTDRIVIAKTKNGEPVGIPMIGVVKEVVKEVIRLRRIASPYVFCDEQGRPFSPSSVSMAFKRACNRAGVKNLRLHDLRHDFATLLISKRKNLVEVQHALGHKDPRMTLRYAHLMPDDLKEVYEAIDNKGTATILLHLENKKGAASVTP